MARIRTIKPEFWTDDKITECSLSARLLFIGIWNFSDDAGNLDRSAKQIKARVFPVDNVDCESLIKELITHGLLTEYSVSDKKYLHIPGFADHQVINRPSKPVVPPYEDSLSTPVPLTEESVTTHVGREGNGKEGKEIARVAREPAPLGETSETPNGKTSATRKRKTSKSPEVPLPEDFGLDPELEQYALDHLPAVDPKALMEKFRLQARTKQWTYADWRLAFMTYIRNCAPTSGHWAAGQYPKKVAGGNSRWQ